MLLVCRTIYTEFSFFGPNIDGRMPE